MNISNDISSINNQNVSTSSINNSKLTPKQEGAENIPEKISGEVLNLTRNEITVKTNDGELINAKITNPELLKIGMIGEFKLIQATSGEVALSLISSPRQEMQDKVLSDTLLSLGLKSNAENKEIVKLLLNNSFPVTKENFQKLNQAIKIVGSDKPQNAIFFLNNDIKPSFKVAENLTAYTNQEIKLSNQLTQLTDNIIAHNDTNILQNAVSSLYSNKVNEQISKEINNLPLLKETAINFIDKQLSEANIPSENNVLNNIASSTEKALITNESSTAQSDNINQLSQTNEFDKTLNQPKQADDFKLFLENNSKGILEFIKNEIKTNTLDKLADNIKTNFELPTEFNNITTREFMTKLFEIFPKLEKPINDLNKATDSIKKEIEKAFFVDTDKKTENNPLSKHLSSVNEKLNQLKTTLESGETNPNTLQSLKLIDNISNNFKFSSMLQNTIFLQFPVTINNEKTTAELYVFKDKNKKPKKNGQATALLALDTAFLGHLEAYVQKNHQSISCQFRLQNDEIQEIISKNINLLNSYLKNYNLSLDNVSYKKITEPFTIVDNEPVDLVNTLKDFTFDMQT